MRASTGATRRDAGSGVIGRVEEGVERQGAGSAGRNRRWLVLVAALVVVGGIVAAAFVLMGDDDDTTATGPGEGLKERSAEGLELAAEDLASKRFRGRVRPSYRLLTEGCRERVTQDQWARHLFGAAALIKSEHGVEAKDVQVENVEVRRVRERQGQAKFGIAGPDGDVVYDSPWEAYRYEGGSWRLAACNNIQPAGEGTGAGGAGEDT